MRLIEKLLPIAVGLLVCGAIPARSGERVAAQAADSVQLAQLFNRPQPPADLDDDEPVARGGQDAGALVVRIDRLEGQIRSLTGQIEQLQFQIRRLEEQGRGPGPAVAAAPQPVSVPPLGAPVTIGTPGTTPVTVPTTAPASDLARLRRGDAFNPAADPNAPGAPRPLGSTTPSAPLAAPTSGPLAVRTTAPAGLQPMDLGQPKPPVVETAPGGTVIATAQPPSPKEEYDLAAAFLKQGQYDQAEKSFSAFITKNPKNRYAADAVFGLGESYFQRGRHREAAEQYLKISTNYSTSAKGAEALLRLGESLNALGAKEQACASFSEIGRKYPNASSTIRAAEREAKKNAC